MREEWIPIVGFIAFGATICLWLYFRYRARQDMQGTIRAAIDKGQELSPDLIEQLAGPKRPADRDLRLGIIGIAIAVATSMFGIMIPEAGDEAMQVFLGLSAFPFILGLAFLLMHKLRQGG